ncbi:hypothetical protein CROQUDRAFT_51945 [Cronartium quercuum f. sp. fusiforme G11]|uniref:GATA-type domain-containing protein n=1 Tax=Cronartium quercuum f. sp. fusiforme G11 TaxID=708437 RepID=A0A9P6T793_9BASI|nr:hypothetical protein CROQUDRAFT_51945 [Cronartium quercuum f. sp. fusiforme G11]
MASKGTCNNNLKVITKTSCVNCGTTETPLWRRDSEGKTICNACGENYDRRLISTPFTFSFEFGGEEVALGATCCENCGTKTTPLWRRDGEGRVACNACGLYYKLHGAHRPVGMKRAMIKRRKRLHSTARVS